MFFHALYSVFENSAKRFNRAAFMEGLQGKYNASKDKTKMPWGEKKAEGGEAKKDDGHGKPAAAAKPAEKKDEPKKDEHKAPAAAKPPAAPGAKPAAPAGAKPAAPKAPGAPGHKHH